MINSSSFGSHTTTVTKADDTHVFTLDDSSSLITLPEVSEVSSPHSCGDAPIRLMIHSDANNRELLQYIRLRLPAHLQRLPLTTFRLEINKGSIGPYNTHLGDFVRFMTIQCQAKYFSDVCKDTLWCFVDHLFSIKAVESGNILKWLSPINMRYLDVMVQHIYPSNGGFVARVKSKLDAYLNRPDVIVKEVKRQVRDMMDPFLLQIIAFPREFPLEELTEKERQRNRASIFWGFFTGLRGIQHAETRLWGDILSVLSIHREDATRIHLIWDATKRKKSKGIVNKSLLIDLDRIESYSAAARRCWEFFLAYVENRVSIRGEYLLPAFDSDPVKEQSHKLTTHILRSTVRAALAGRRDNWEDLVSLGSHSYRYAITVLLLRLGLSEESIVNWLMWAEVKAVNRDGRTMSQADLKKELADMRNAMLSTYARFNETFRALTSFEYQLLRGFFTPIFDKYEEVGTVVAQPGEVEVAEV